MKHAGKGAGFKKGDPVMARMPRIKCKDQGGTFHLYNRIPGDSEHYPMADAEARRKFLSILFFYSRVYCCLLLAWAVLSNHWHAVAKFEAFRELPRAELREIAKRLYKGRLNKPYLLWVTKKQWSTFNHRLFDVSEFMRNVNSDYGVWYNSRYGRKGRLWADRFKSTLLKSPASVRAAVLYVELNAVRAGLVQKPERHLFSSARLRLQGFKDPEWLLPLIDLWGVADPVKALKVHFARLYHRGGLRPTEEEQLLLDMLAEDEANGNGFGIYRENHRCFTNGLVLGSAEDVQAWEEELIRKRVYKKPRGPFQSGAGPIAMLRPQLSNRVKFPRAA
jgi:putative transposase